jgi:hypothetical protein
MVVTYRRLNIHSLENGLHVSTGADVRDCWIHDLDPAGVDPHVDGLQCDDGASQVTVIHNNFDMRDNGPTSAGIQNSTNDPSNFDWLFENNLVLNSPIDGGATIRVQKVGVDATANNIRFVNNRLGAGEFGYVIPDPPDTITEWSGNVDHFSGEPVP